MGNKATTTEKLQTILKSVKDKSTKIIVTPGSGGTSQFAANTDEKAEDAVVIASALDVAFVLDCTASMAPYIKSCKENINSISTKISEEVEDCDVQFALTMYRDIPPEDYSFITKTVDFTPYPFKIQMELDPIQASGGGDHPECLTSALFDCSTNLKWREEAIKIIIVITDAPPHGLEKNLRDAFPDGDPDTFGVHQEDNDKEGDEGARGVEDTLGNESEPEGDANPNDQIKGKNKETKHLNVISIIEQIRDKLGATIYSVGCEPDLSVNHDFAIDFMRYLAEFTKGKFLPLSSAKLLPEVIVGSVKQQIRMKHLKDNLDAEIVKIKEEFGDDISPDKLNQMLKEKFKAAGIRKKEIGTGTLYRVERPRDNVELLMNGQKCRSLQDFKAQCTAIQRLTRSDFRHLNTGNGPKPMSAPIPGGAPAPIPMGVAPMGGVIYRYLDGLSDVDYEALEPHSVYAASASIPRPSGLTASQQMIGAVASQPHQSSVPTGQHSVSQLSAGAGGQTSAPMLEVNPLTSEMLEEAEPEERKRMIGERLFPKVQMVEPRLGGKITGMLLEMHNEELLELLSDNGALMDKIKEAVAVLKEHQLKQSQQMMTGIRMRLNELRGEMSDSDCSQHYYEDSREMSVGDIEELM